ncbi:MULTISPECIES: flotillin family protein [Brevibacillus]|uniref:Membrane protein n=1 Tax=Brevibacillus parabrevis TaxID=54914 RepID=A0A4Y3PH63_BREPA|nr:MULTISPECIES: flotillin family protein [Brevibacillus]RNB94917.1 flotillin family protein [Brevibacillus parabrevis]GEB32637.1 membrane protein [Brevibacillus parabrevis]HBZ81397.1 flotillin [Brevibacillus sp.]
MFEPDILVTVGIVVAVFLVLGIAFWARYKTVGADEAMIVTGSYLGTKNVLSDESGRKMKIVRGGGAFILPIFQQANFLSLLSHKLDVSTPEVYTEQGVPVMADGVAIIKVGGSIEDIATAAEQFMGKKDEALRAEAQEVLEGYLRAILGSMTVEEIYKNRERFAQEVQSVATKDLKKMGLSVVSFTIKDVRDKNGYLAALGIPQIAAVKRDATISQADADKEARIRQAQAEEEARKAELLKETNIAEAEKDKELKVAAFKQEQDRAKASADQAYKLQEAVAKQQVTEEEMKIDLVRKQKEIELEEKEILRREKQYDAEVKKKADADRYSVEQAAEAEKAKKLREADALKYRIEAEAKAMAEQKRLEGLAIAEAEKAKGSAEAEVTRLKLEAEAEGKEKLAEAFEKFGHAAILDIIAKMLPELAEKIAEPMRAIDKVTIVDAGGGQGDGVNRLSGNVTKLMAQLPEMLKDVSGLDMNKMISDFMQKGSAAQSVPTANQSQPAAPSISHLLAGNPADDKARPANKTDHKA